MTIESDNSHVGKGDKSASDSRWELGAIVVADVASFHFCGFDSDKKASPPNIWSTRAAQKIRAVKRKTHRRLDKMEAAAQRFFSSPYFAVIGASQDKSKFGYRILAWYHQHSLRVTPINPTRPTIALPSRTYDTVSSVSSLSHPGQTALSFLTPPAITWKVLEEAKTAGVTAVWLQPGSFEDRDLKYAEENFESAVGGFEDGTVGGEGWCVLVDGENALRGAGKKIVTQKL